MSKIKELRDELVTYLKGYVYDDGSVDGVAFSDVFNEIKADTVENVFNSSNKLEKPPALYVMYFGSTSQKQGRGVYRKLYDFDVVVFSKRSDDEELYELTEYVEKAIMDLNQIAPSWDIINDNPQANPLSNSNDIYVTYTGRKRG